MSMRGNPAPAPAPAPAHDGFEPETPSSAASTVVASPSIWKENSKHFENPTQLDPVSKSTYLDVPSFRPSLDSTYSDLSELAFHSSELHTRHPLVRNLSRDATTAASNRRPPPSRFRAAWDSFIETNYGALLVLASQGFGTGMNISARLLETPGAHGEPMHPFQILFVRQSITALICTVYGVYTKSIPDFPFGVRGIRWLLILRGITGFFGVFGMYFSLLYLPLSEATVLGFLTPILTCYCCSFVIPGETFSAQQQIAGFVSLIGVLFIARPASLLSVSSTSTQPSDGLVSPPSNSTTAAEPSQQVTQHQHLVAVGIAMIGVVGGTGALTAIRVIGTKAHAFVSINYFSIWCSVVSLICLVIFPEVKFRLPGNLTEWGTLAVLGFCGFVMQFLLTAGLAYGGPGQDEHERHTVSQGSQKVHDLENTTGAAHMTHVVPYRPKPKASGNRATAMCYTQMLFALAGDKLIFGVTPDTMSWIGSGLILAGAVWVAAARDKKKSIHSHGRGGGADAGGTTSALQMLRDQVRGKGDASHEETTGLMNDQDEGNEIVYDEDGADEGQRHSGHDGKTTESLELHELRSSASA